MHYRHTQTSRLIILSVTATLVFLVAISLVDPAPPVAIALVVPAIAIVLLLFYCLTVEVGGGELRIRYGIGLVRKSWPLAEIERVEAVRQPWYYGWGIRWTPRGWLYRVSGLEAVEVRLRGGKTFFVGSDEPQALARELRARLAAGR